MHKSIRNHFTPKLIRVHVTMYRNGDGVEMIRMEDEGNPYARFYFERELMAMGGEPFAGEGVNYRHRYTFAPDVPASVQAVLGW